MSNQKCNHLANCVDQILTKNFFHKAFKVDIKSFDIISKVLTYLRVALLLVHIQNG